jgi:hypothetical protein
LGRWLPSSRRLRRAQKEIDGARTLSAQPESLLLAQFKMDIGFFLLTGQPRFFLLYLPIGFTVYKRWVANEERFLEKEFAKIIEPSNGKYRAGAFNLDPRRSAAMI